MSSDASEAGTIRVERDERGVVTLTLDAPGTVATGDDPDARGDRDLAYTNLMSCRLIPQQGDLVHLGRDRHRRFGYEFEPFRSEELVP